MKRSTKAERWFNEGVQHYQAGNPQKAFAAWEQAAGIYQDLIDKGQPQYRLNLAQAQMHQGVALVALNRSEEALARCEEAAKIYQDLIDDKQPQYRPNLAHSRMGQGNALSALNRPEEALAPYEEAASIYQDLIAAGESQYRLNLALTRINEGYAHYALKQPKKALVCHREAQALIDDNQPQYLALARMGEGNALAALDRPDEALAAHKEAASIYQDLIDKNQLLQYRPNLAHVRMNQGNAHYALKQHEEALDRYREAARLYQALIEAGQIEYRPMRAQAQMHQGVALVALKQHEEALVCHRESVGLFQALIADGQIQYRPRLALAWINQGDTLAGLNRPDEAVDCCHLALEVWVDDEAMPAVALETMPDLAELIAQTQSAAGFAARVERLAQQIARALSGVAPEHLGQFYPLAEEAFIYLLNAALYKKEWDLALTVIGTARAQRLAKLAQADLLDRADREDDPAELREYREAIRRFAELEILLNVGAGPGTGGGANGRGGGEDAGGQYRALYDEYTDLRRQLDKLEQTLRQRGLLPDLGAGLFDGAGLRQKLPPQAALLVLVEIGKSPAVVILTRDNGQKAPMEGGSDWTRRLDDITRTLKGRGRTLRDGPGWNIRAANADGNTSDTPREPVDTQAEALTEMLAEQFWQPVQGVLGDEVKTVWLLPTGDLHGLPWQASAPPGWRCRLAPAPGFVRQALDRTPDPAPLHPTAAAPLGALTYAAPDSDKELLHMPLEESGMRAIWEDAARPLAGLDQASAPPPAFIALAGHGDSDAAIPGAARIWVGREGAEPRHVGFGELWNAPLPGLQSLYLSSCVVGRTREVNGEPLGLISAGLLRGARYLVGWSVPVDDLGAALFSLLYHWLWRECADPEEALTRARSAFLTGDWPPSAVERARPLLADHLHDLLMEWIKIPNKQPARKALLRKTLSNLYKDAGESPDALESWKQRDSEAARADAEKLAAEKLAAGILARRAQFPFRYIGRFALGFGSTGQLSSAG